MEEDQKQEDHHHHLAQLRLFPGFLFAPTDEILITSYLQRRLSSNCSMPNFDGLIVEFDIYGCNPWELPRHLFRYPGDQREMYFFTPTHPIANAKGRGKRCGRTAGCGVWHGNGKDNLIKSFDAEAGKSVVVGHTTSFKFEVIVDASNNSSRIKTNWLMHEYRLQSICGNDHKGLVLCKIYEKRPDATCCSGLESVVDDQPQQRQQLKRKRDEEPVGMLDDVAAESIIPTVACMEETQPFGPSAFEQQKEAFSTMQEGQTMLKRSRIEQAEEQPQQQCSTAMMGATNYENINAAPPSCSDQPSSSSFIGHAFSLQGLLGIDDFLPLPSPPSAVPFGEIADAILDWPEFTLDWDFQPEEIQSESIPFLDDFTLLACDDPFI